MTDHHARSGVVSEDDLRPWEPWTPKVGDRVRIRLNGECRFPTKDPMGGERVEHYPNQNGLLGTVEDVKWRPGDHPYFVVTDEEVHHRWCSSGAGYFAAIELEPLDGASS